MVGKRFGQLTDGGTDIRKTICTLAFEGGIISNTVMFYIFRRRIMLGTNNSLFDCRMKGIIMSEK